MSIEIKSGTYKHTQNKASVFTRVKFEPPFAAGKTVIVTPMVQTFNGAQSPSLRIKNVSVTGFDVCIYEIRGGKVKADGVHLPETMGWIAVGQDCDSGQPV